MMDGFNVDVSGLFGRLDKSVLATQAAEIKALEEANDDLALIASNIAPIDTSTLRQSVNTEIEIKPYGLIGRVTFSAVEDGFDYALWTHEADYTLGEKSAQAPGYRGYAVGNQYLTRPLYGESVRYFGIIAAAVREAMNT